MAINKTRKKRHIKKIVKKVSKRVLAMYKDPNTVEETNTVYKKTIDFATFKATVCNKTKDE